MKKQGHQRFRFAPSLGRAGALVLIAAALLRCGAGEAPGPAGPAPAPSPLMLSPSNQQIAHGTALQYRLRQLQPSGQVVDLTQKGVWKVLAADGRVLQQAEAGAGLVALAEPGQYRVSASYEGRTVATAVFVTAATLKSLAISPTAPKVAKGLTQQFTATATFSDGTTQDVTALSSWSIKDTTGTGVAGINSRGLATARSIGKARITARYLTASATATLEVTAATLRTLALSPLTPVAAKGTAQRFTATGTFSDGTVQDVTSSADVGRRRHTGPSAMAKRTALARFNQPAIHGISSGQSFAGSSVSGAYREARH